MWIPNILASEDTLLHMKQLNISTLNSNSGRKTKIRSPKLRCNWKGFVIITTTTILLEQTTFYSFPSKYGGLFIEVHLIYNHNTPSQHPLTKPFISKLGILHKTNFYFLLRREENPPVTVKLVLITRPWLILDVSTIMIMLDICTLALTAFEQGKTKTTRAV